MTLTYFTVTGNYRSVSGQELWDTSGASPQERPLTGSVTFTPIFDDGDAAVTASAVMVVQPVSAVIKNGVLSRNGVVGCKLVANSGLGLQALFYRVSFFGLRALDGSEVVLRSFSFQAPTASSTVDLRTVAPVAGTPAVGVSPVVPVTATSTGQPGQIAYSNTHIYICTAVNTWRRASLSSW